ncbi:hypothetical protein [Bradyrhizobium diversitatis]|uniref:Uncharacterized protein n=1 Tax=Bradyrhizobium diversitatis TaxID=2755406 RepID=A0ABS0P073_9BRAD|nr:hypothetical protein [Bradyrhizobium diversitatis]MBH5386668.1 hypothetical protein [Bradyrhizobium diversitatis]
MASSASRLANPRNGGVGESGKAPRRDGFDLMGGGALKLLATISESLETLIDGPIHRRQTESQEMENERRIDPGRTVEQQQRPEEAEQAQAGKAGMEVFLQQRARGLGIDRGRGR